MTALCDSDPLWEALERAEEHALDLHHALRALLEAVECDACHAVLKVQALEQRVAALEQGFPAVDWQAIKGTLLDLQREMAAERDAADQRARHAQARAIHLTRGLAPREPDSGGDA